MGKQGKNTKCNMQKPKTEAQKAALKKARAAKYQEKKLEYAAAYQEKKKDPVWHANRLANQRKNQKKHRAMQKHGPKTEAQKDARKKYMAARYQEKKLEYAAAYQEKMKDTVWRTNRLENQSKSQKKHRATQKYADTTAKRNALPETKAKSVASSQKFLKSECGKLYRKNWRHNSSKGIAGQKRDAVARKKKLEASPTLRIRKALCDHLGRRISGSPGAHSMQQTLEKYTDFVDSDIVPHFESQLKPWMTIHNYGSVWSIAHKIPKFWYGDSVENNHRLNRKANLGCDYEVDGYGEKTNSSKNIDLPSDEEMLAQGKHCWPVEWMGMLPSKEYRDARIAKHREKQKRVSSKAANDQ